MNTPLRYRRPQVFSDRYASVSNATTCPNRDAAYKSLATKVSGVQNEAEMAQSVATLTSSTLSVSTPPQRRVLDRADRVKGRIVDPLRDLPHEAPIQSLLSSTAPSHSTKSSPQKESLVSSRCHHITNFASIRGQTDPTSTPFKILVKLPSRQVLKPVTDTTTAQELANLLVRDHRLEFEFEHNNEGEDDDIILWECRDGTRRPLRPDELLLSIMKRWGRAPRHYLRTTSTSLRNDVDSLASLIPRRDMLRTPPTITGAEVNFSRPSVMYNAHLNTQYALPKSPSHSSQNEGEFEDAGGLRRVPSKLNPTDRLLSTKRVQADNDDVALHSQLVWGFGSLDLCDGRIVLKQKPGDELVCSVETGDTDVYEWAHTGPKKYVVILRAQRSNSRAVYISTDSAKVFSVLRNAIYTARTKALLDQRYT